MTVYGFSWTRGMQGGIGYPPLVIKYKGQWTLVEDSQNHGGTVCSRCTLAETGHYPIRIPPKDRFSQPTFQGVPCIAARVETLRPKVPLYFNRLPRITWQEFEALIKREG